MKLRELLEKRSRAYEAMTTIVEGASQAGKLTAAEKERFRAAELEYDYLTPQISLERAKATEAAEKAMKGGKTVFSSDAGTRSDRRPILGEMATALLKGKTDSRAFSVSGQSATIDTDRLTDEFIPHIQHENALAAAGAKFQNEENFKKWPKQGGKPMASWVAENAESSDDAAMTLSSIQHVDSTLRILPIRVSREWADDSGELGMRMLDDAISAAINDKLIETVFNGTGTNQPTGIDNTAGVNFVNVGGALASYTPFANAMKKCLFDQARLENMSIIYGPEVAAQVAALQDLDDNPMQVPPVLEKMGWHYTYSLTQAGAQAYVGDFRGVRVGLMGPLRLQLNELFARNNQIGFVAYLRAAVSIDYPGHICRVIGITSQAPTT